MNKQVGVSLSEVLISLFLSTLIITLLMQFYLSSKRQYVEVQKILTTNFDLHWVSELFSDSIRRAGFTPCFGIDELQVLDRRTQGGLIQGLKISTQPQQSVQVQRMSEHFAKVKALTSRSELLLADSITFSKHRPLLIADCMHAEVQQIANSEHSLIRLDKPLLFDYSLPIYVGEFIDERWFIKNNRLYYHLVQTEEVTSLVHSLAVENNHPKGKPLLKIIMGLTKNKSYEFWVAVRGL
ncbi:MAG: prepilin cleavage protein [Legionella sp.]|uniref:PilW family protein n=1 Tax=Legionella sp. TaxID=459 RepID=UPI0039E47368